MIVAVFAGWMIGNNMSRERAKEPVTVATGTPSVVTKLVPITAATPTLASPNLNRPIKVLTKLPDQIVATAVQRIKELAVELRKSPDLHDSWLDLALSRKLIGDYDAAEEIWIYMTQKWINDATAYNNLADLYLVVRHDNARAEIYLLRAIEKNPTQVMFYENAYSFYRFVKKDLAKAEQILNKGIARNPSNVEGLKKFLADLKAI